MTRSASLLAVTLPFLVLLLLGSAQEVAAAPASLATLMPESTVVYMEIDLSDKTVAALKRFAGWKILSNPRVLALMNKELAEVQEEMKKESGLTFKDLEQLLGGRAALAITKFPALKKVVRKEMPRPMRETPRPDKDMPGLEDGHDHGHPVEAVEEVEHEIPPSFVFVLDPGPNEEKMVALVNKAIAFQVKQSGLVRRNLMFKGVAYSKMIPGKKNPKEKVEVGYLCFLPSGWLVSSNDEDSLKAVITRAKDKAQPSLAQQKPFRAMQARMDGNQALAYVSIPELLKLALAQERNDEEMKKGFKAFGLNLLTSAGGGLFIEKKGLRARLFVPMAKGKNAFLDLLTGIGRPRKGLAAIPAEAIVVSGYQLRPKKVWNVFVELANAMTDEDDPPIENQVKRMEGQLGVNIQKDILDNFTGDLVVGLMSPGRDKDGKRVSDKPTTITVFTIRNKAAVDKFLKAIHVNDGNDTEEFNGFTLVEDSVAYSNEYLIICDDNRGQLKNAINVAVGNSRSIATNKEFKAALRALGKGPQAIGYLNIPVVLELVRFEVKGRAEKRKELEKDLAEHLADRPEELPDPDEAEVRKDWRLESLQRRLKALGTKEDDVRDLAIINLAIAELKMAAFAQLESPDGYLVEVILR